MSSDSEDDYEQFSDFEMLEPDDDFEHDTKHDTPVTAPQTPRSLRPSELKTILCPYDNCFKIFNRQARLNEHLRSHTNTRPYKCPHPPCVKDFIRDSHLKRHLKSAHSNVRDYTCSWDGCNKSFATGTRLRRHEAAHEGKEKYRCHGYEGCNEIFRKHDTLRRHIISVHKQMRPFPCEEIDVKTGEQCNQGFETAEKLRAHQRSRHDNTRFACILCLDGMDNNSSSDHDAMSPTKTHRFTTYADLQIHNATVHPPTCHGCGTSFTTAKELTRHVELQHPEFNPDTPSKPEFKCSYPDCSRSFSKKGNLNVHIRTVHENRRDFVCGQTEVILPDEAGEVGQLCGCGRAFTSKASLEEHVRTSHLGLESRRTERQKKRKVEKREAGDEDIAAPKKRKQRKDKGVKKTSALDSLLGGRSPTPKAQNVPQKDDEEEQDYGQYLTGSMTMYGSQIYHHDPGLREYTNHIEMRQSYFKTDGNDETIFEAAPFDDDDIDDVFSYPGFEQIDPLLMQQG